jgi:hypothetical protein
MEAASFPISRDPLFILFLIWKEKTKFVYHTLLSSLIYFARVSKFERIASTQSEYAVCGVLGLR